MDNKLKSIYNAYVEKGILSPETTLKQFSEADSSIIESLYSSGVDANLISNQTSVEQFGSIFKKKEESLPESTDTSAPLESETPSTESSEMTIKKPSLLRQMRLLKVCGQVFLM